MLNKLTMTLISYWINWAEFKHPFTLFKESSWIHTKTKILMSRNLMTDWSFFYSSPDTWPHRWSQSCPPCFLLPVRKKHHPTTSQGMEEKLFFLTTPVHLGIHQVRLYLAGVKVLFLFRSPLETAFTCPPPKLYTFSQLRTPTYFQFKSSLISTVVPKMLGRCIFDHFIPSPYLLLYRRLGMLIVMGGGK